MWSNSQIIDHTAFEIPLAVHSQLFPNKTGSPSSDRYSHSLSQSVGTYYQDRSAVHIHLSSGMLTQQWLLSSKFCPGSPTPVIEHVSLQHFIVSLSAEIP